MDITAIVDLAKQGSRLASDKQWILADALAGLDASDVQAVAVESGRNENTLLQYARAAERWSPSSSRVEGVTFSAHRVALSWHDPRSLLLDLKMKHGSPTVSQVRQAMGLEGHPAMELIERGIRKLDDNVRSKDVGNVITTLTLWHKYLTGIEADASPRVDDTPVVASPNGLEEEEAPIVEVEEETPTTKGWTPPISTADIAGM